MSDPLASIPLSAIRVFEAAARHLSFTRAAEELGMTQAAVSWQVKALERRLDQPLFRRLPREVALTAAGERLARAASDAMTGLRSAVADITESGEGMLTISTLQTFATQWLAGRLGGFQVAHPGLAVRLDTDGRLVDLLREGVDVAIRSLRSGPPDAATLEAVFLFPSAQTVLCTPPAMAALGADPTPGALLDVARVGAEVEWAQWFRNAGVTPPGEAAPAAPRLAADTQTLEVAAAIAAGAAAIASPVMFARDIAEGRLVQPFDVYIGRNGGYWLAYPKDRRRARKIAAFREWLSGQVAQDPAAQRLIAALAS
jgi:LysR family transcriptional regulator, glycine cleavage system transcriptional activator